jgi:hypothetical protein
VLRLSFIGVAPLHTVTNLVNSVGAAYATPPKTRTRIIKQVIIARFINPKYAEKDFKPFCTLGGLLSLQSDNPEDLVEKSKKEADDTEGNWNHSENEFKEQRQNCDYSGYDRAEGCIEVKCHDDARSGLVLPCSD